MMSFNLSVQCFLKAKPQERGVSQMAACQCFTVSVGDSLSEAVLKPCLDCGLSSRHGSLGAQKVARVVAECLEPLPELRPGLLAPLHDEQMLPQLFSAEPSLGFGLV